MSNRLRIYNESDGAFTGVFTIRTLSAGADVGIWYLFAKFFRIFQNKNHLTTSLPVVALVSLIYAKGFIYHLMAARNNINLNKRIQEENYAIYRTQHTLH